MSPPDWPAPYTGSDFLADTLEQVRELEAVRRQWEKDFLADLERMGEWQP
jgi:hypothetical protein